MPATLTLPAEAQVPANSTVVEIDVQLTPLDMYRASRATAWRQVRRMILLVWPATLLISLLRGGLFLFILVSLVSLFSFAVHSLLMYMGARSTLRTSRVLRGVIHYSFEPHCLRSRGQTFWTIQDWSNLYEVLETRHLLILRSSSAQKVVIPKRYLLGGTLEKVRAIARKSPATPLASNPQSSAAASSAILTATVLMQTEDLYQGFFILLLRKSYWYAIQLAFPLFLIYALNPQFLSPLSFVAVGSIFCFYMAISIYRASGKAIRTNVAYQSAITYAFGASGLDGAGLTHAFHHDWGNFQAVIEGSKIFVFCPSSAQMVIVPKRSFAAPARIIELRQLLKTHYQGKLSLKHY
jgi:hypothetical protein